MKKLLLISGLFFLVLTLTACEDVCIGAECLVDIEDPDHDPDPDPNEDCDVCETCDVCEDCPVITGTEVDNALQFMHINGHGDETDKFAFILLEYQLRDYVRYQITYLSCTCRNADVNYWQVAFVEINRYTNDIRTITYGDDSSEHYTAGMWGDSSPTPAGKTLEDFEAEFIPWLIGKSLEDLGGISVFTNAQYFDVLNTTAIAEQDLIDGYAGSSVSTNNMIRVMKVLLEYHEENYE